MRWFVSRFAFDTVLQSRDAQRERDASTIALLRESLRLEEKRSSYLMDTVIAMKLSGGSVQRLSPIEPGRKVEQPKRSRIQQAIDECPAAATNPRQRAYLDSWAAKELERGVTEEEVLEKIRRYSIVSETDEDDETDQGVVEL